MENKGRRLGLMGPIMENKGRGLGLMGPWKGELDWFGGRIQQLARSYVEDGQLHIKLEPMEKQRPLPDNELSEATSLIHEQLCHHFVLCGRIFVPFHAKEGSIYRVEIDDFSCRQPRCDCGDQFLLPFSTLSRFALGLSNSLPVIEFEAESIIFIKAESGCIFSVHVQR